MTTVVAVKKGKRLCLASDSLSTFGSRKEESGKQTHGTGKFIQVGPNFIGMSGDHCWDLVLEHYFSKKKIVSAWKSAEQIFELVNEMHKDLKQTYSLTVPQLSFLPLESSELQILIMNPQGIFEVEYSRMVRQYTKYSAIGTGEDYALGAMSAVYDRLTDPEEIARVGVEAAAQFDRKTALPLYVHSIRASSYGH